MLSTTWRGSWGTSGWAFSTQYWRALGICEVFYGCMSWWSWLLNCRSGGRHELVCLQGWGGQWCRMVIIQPHHVTSFLRQSKWCLHLLCKLLVVILARNFSQVPPPVQHIHVLSMPQYPLSLFHGGELWVVDAIVCKRLSSTYVPARGISSPHRSSWRCSFSGGGHSNSSSPPSALNQLGHPHCILSPPGWLGYLVVLVHPSISLQAVIWGGGGLPLAKVMHLFCQLGEQPSPLWHHLRIFPLPPWGLGSLALMTSWVLVTSTVLAAALVLVTEGMAHTFYLLLQ